MKNELRLDLLLPFFENSVYAGWKNIATKLILYGECIVAGNECIWKGGIGNFIKTEPAENLSFLIDCLKYSFDREYFLTSNWAAEYIEDFIVKKEKEKCELMEKLNSVNDDLQQLYPLVK